MSIARTVAQPSLDAGIPRPDPGAYRPIEPSPPGSPVPLQVHVTPFPGRGPRRVGVEVSGEIDLASAGMLTELLHTEIDRGRDQMVLNLDRVGFCGIAALDVLNQARTRAARHGGHLSIAGASSAVRRLLTLAATIGAEFPFVAPTPSHPPVTNVTTEYT